MAMSAYLNIPDPRYEISAEEAEKLPATQNNTFLCTACGSPVTLVPHGERHTAYFRGTHHHPDCILARLRLGLSQELSNEEREYLRKNLDLKTTLFDLAHLRAVTDNCKQLRVSNDPPGCGSGSAVPAGPGSHHCESRRPEVCQTPLTAFLPYRPDGLRYDR